MSDHTPFLPGLSPLTGRSLHLRFDAGAMSSNGGALILREIERKLGIANLMASCVVDRRRAERTRHDYATMIRARMMAIACGYEDCNDLDALRHDPALKIACERLPEAEIGLPSQPTLSRFENLPDWRALVRMGQRFIDLFCDSYRTVPKRIVLDIDDIIDRTYGAQQLSLFSTHAGGRCLQPIHIYEARSGKPVACVLRPGKRPSGVEAVRVLRFVIQRIRTLWPRTEIMVRGDGHYGTPEVMDLLEQRNCPYMFGLPGNARLHDIARPWGEDTAVRRARSGEKTLRRCYQASYAAQSWSRPRRIIARVEASIKHGVCTRFIVTNLTGRAAWLYKKVYCVRGRMENMIKEHKRYTQSDRTSCHRWEANQCRLFLHTAAYWLLWQLRSAASRRSRWRTATFHTIRTTFLKVAVRVQQRKSRITLSMPQHTPNQPMLAIMLQRLAAQGP